MQSSTRLFGSEYSGMYNDAANPNPMAGPVLQQADCKVGVSTKRIVGETNEPDVVKEMSDVTLEMKLGNSIEAVVSLEG